MANTQTEAMTIHVQNFAHLISGFEEWSENVLLVRFVDPNTLVSDLYSDQKCAGPCFVLYVATLYLNRIILT